MTRTRQRAVPRFDELRDWHRQESTQIKAVYLLAFREAGGAENPYDDVTALRRVK